jgi:hypothetical protein
MAREIAGKSFSLNSKLDFIIIPGVYKVNFIDAWYYWWYGDCVNLLLH